MEDNKRLLVLRIINLAFIVSIFIYGALIYFTLGEKALKVQPITLTSAVFSAISLVDVILGVMLSALLMSRCRERSGENKEKLSQCFIAPYLIRWAFFESGAVIGVAGALIFREGLLIWLIPSLISLIALTVDHVGTYMEF